nr:hypothetical protein [Tanacetum cinerariifolium]
MSLSPHSTLIPSDSDIENTFSSTNILNYFSASSGSISPDSSNNFTKYLLDILVFLPLHDDSKMKVIQACDTIPSPQVVINLPTILSPSTVLSLSPIFDSQDLFPSKKISPKDTETPVESLIPLFPYLSLKVLNSKIFIISCNEALDACAALTRRVEHLEHDKVAQALEITKLKKRVKKLERANKERMIANLDRDTEVVIRDPKEESTAIIPAKTKSKDKGKGIMVEEPKPMKKKQQVEMDEEYARKLHEELNKDIDRSVIIDHVKQTDKEDSYVQRYQVMKKRPQIEAQAQRNMIMYLKNFLLKSKEQLEEEENRAIESINETLAQKAAKRRKLNEEVEDLKQHLEIVHDEDDDVYT